MRVTWQRVSARARDRGAPGGQCCVRGRGRPAGLRVRLCALTRVCARRSRCRGRWPRRAWWSWVRAQRRSGSSAGGAAARGHACRFHALTHNAFCARALPRPRRRRRGAVGGEVAAVDRVHSRGACASRGAARRRHTHARFSFFSPHTRPRPAAAPTRAQHTPRARAAQRAALQHHVHPTPPRAARAACAERAAPTTQRTRPVTISSFSALICAPHLCPSPRARPSRASRPLAGARPAGLRGVDHHAEQRQQQQRQRRQRE
jgi:hypothetical protein